MSYNYYRSTSKDRNNQSTEKLIKMQKREKLKGLLITKFMKKYGIKNPEKILEDEITKFLQGQVLTNADLDRLDAKLRKLLNDKKDQDILRKDLSCSVEKPNYSVKLPDIESMSVKSHHSKMSGASNLSKFNENPMNQNNIREEQDFDSLSISSRKQHVERMDFSHEGDEWNAIALYNHKMFEEEKRLNKIKDLEVKKRTKEDLDNQIRHKLKNLNEEQLKNKEHDEKVLHHLEFLKNLEEEKQAERKRRMLVEKENRDRQLKDEKTRKKLELKKEKLYEKELVKHLVDEIEKEKKTSIERKIKEKEVLQKTLKDNELNKVKQIEAIKRERDEDIQLMKEFALVLDKQEQDRIEYFKAIERNANNFISNMSGTVLKDRNEKNKIDEERMNKYLTEKEKRIQEEEERKKIEIFNNKKLMKNYLDMQVDEKKRFTEFEKKMDSEQARVWKTDTLQYHQQEKDIYEKVRNLNKTNADYLKTQIDMKRSGGLKKMTDLEYAMNKDLLEKIKSH